MAKSKLTIGRFDAGMVEGPNPRDISDEASTKMEGFDPTTIGGLRAIGGYTATTIPDFGKVYGLLLNQTNGTEYTGHGYGLFQFTSDYPNLPLGFSKEIGSDGVLSVANPDITHDATSVTNTEETLYTILLYTSNNVEDQYSQATTLRMAVHWYSLHDAGATHNKWYAVGRNLNVGTREGSPNIFQQGTHEEFLSRDNVTTPGDTVNWPFGTPNKPYLPKFYLVNGYPRIYCGNKSHDITYFLGYIKRGASANIAVDATAYGYGGDSTWLESDGAQDACWQINQWSLEPNFLKKPNIKVLDDTVAMNTAHNNTVVMSFQKGTDAIEHLHSEMNSQFATFAFTCQFVEDDEAGFLATGGPMKMYASFVYDGTQEGPLAEVDVLYAPGDSIFSSGSNNPAKNCYMELEAIVSCANAENGMTNVPYTNLNAYPGPRCSGWKVYYAYTGGADVDDDSTEDANIYLLFESDWEKGYRLAGNQHWNTFGPQQYIRHKFMDPPQFEDFLTENGYFPGQDTNALFSTAVYAKQRTFVGNVTKNGVSYPDRILKSPVGMPDIFPDENFIDIVGSDGDEVVHLEVDGDTLLVFKRRTLYLVDISTLDEEKLKDTKPGMGIVSYNHVCKTPHGIAFVNSGGVWLYKGGESSVDNLLQEEGVDKISAETWRQQTNWDTDIELNGKLDIEYSVENDKLIIIVDTIPDNDTSGDVYVYHFRTKSWAIARNGMPQSDGNDSKYYCTQMIRDVNNKLLIAGMNTTGTNIVAGSTVGYETGPFVALMDFFAWDEALEGDTGKIETSSLNWSSKDFDFGNLGAKKSVTKIYITYRIAQRDTSDWSNIYLQYSVDGRTDQLKEFKDGSVFDDKYATSGEIGYTTTSYQGLKHTGGVYRTVELLPADKKECKKIKSFQLHISNAHADGVTKNKLNIDDFTIIYKEHTTK